MKPMVPQRSKFTGLRPTKRAVGRSKGRAQLRIHLDPSLLKTKPKNTALESTHWFARLPTPASPLQNLGDSANQYPRALAHRWDSSRGWAAGRGTRRFWFPYNLQEELRDDSLTKPWQTQWPHHVIFSRCFPDSQSFPDGLCSVSLPLPVAQKGRSLLWAKLHARHGGGGIFVLRGSKPHEADTQMDHTPQCDKRCYCIGPACCGVVWGILHKENLFRQTRN